jgi:hypothetical protein
MTDGRHVREGAAFAAPSRTYDTEADEMEEHLRGLGDIE